MFVASSRMQNSQELIIIIIIITSVCICTGVVTLLSIYYSELFRICQNSNLYCNSVIMETEAFQSRKWLFLKRKSAFIFILDYEHVSGTNSADNPRFLCILYFHIELNSKRLSYNSCFWGKGEKWKLKCTKILKQWKCRISMSLL